MNTEKTMRSEKWRCPTPVGWLKCIRPISLKMLALLISIACFSQLSISAEERVFRTGVHALPRYFSVSPNGDYLIFDTKAPLGGMRLLDLRTGETKAVPAERERLWEMGNLSRDGKRMTAISTGITKGKYNLHDMKIIVINLRDWSWQEISRAGEGVKITPFFSPDGKKVYYFKGEARTEGATPAAKYDLYVIDIESRNEERLTDSRFYQATAGDLNADNSTVFFGRVGGKIPGAVADSDPNVNIRDSGIVAFDIHTKQLRLASHFNSAQFVEIYGPKLDSIGRMYFSGITRAEKGRFIFSLFRYDDNMKTAQRLSSFSNWSRFDIAKQSGDVFVSDTRDEEVVFRRLAIDANQ